MWMRREYRDLCRPCRGFPLVGCAPSTSVLAYIVSPLDWARREEYGLAAFFSNLGTSKF
jgi:hypothetical protein